MTGRHLRSLAGFTGLSCIAIGVYHAPGYHAGTLQFHDKIRLRLFRENRNNDRRVFAAGDVTVTQGRKRISSRLQFGKMELAFGVRVSNRAALRVAPQNDHRLADWFAGTGIHHASFRAAGLAKPQKGRRLAREAGARQGPPQQQS